MEISLARPLPTGKGYVSQWFGEHPDWYKKYELYAHNGIDYAVASGTQILAAHDGTVYNGIDPTGYGKWVRIVGPYYQTIYAHLSKVLFAAGAKIVQGQPLGLSGNTGNSTGPHLHFSIKVNGMRNPGYANWIDPVPFRDI